MEGVFFVSESISKNGNGRAAEWQPDPDNSKAYINPYKHFVGSFIPEWLEVRNEITPGAKLCYARLARHANRETGLAWPKQETLARELGVSERQVRDYLRELEQHNLIESKRRGLKKPNEYRFLRHPWMASDLDRNRGSVPDRNSSSGPLKSEKNQSEENQPTQSPEATGFKSFWKEYPKKVKYKAAKAAWNKLRPSVELRAKIDTAVKQQRASPQWLREDGRYIPDPHKWLNEEQWGDEIAQSGQVLSLDDIRRRAKERAQ
jgi:AraC-like DNA-binding protein